MPKHINQWLMSCMVHSSSAAEMMCDAAKMTHGVAEMMAEWGMVGKPG